MEMSKAEFKEYLEAIIIAIILSFLIITFIIQAFYIPSGSMRPTLKPGDRLFVNKFIYRFEDPERLDIIVFKYPVDPRKKFIKRVIGLPGDRVRIEDGTVYVNGNPLKEDYTLSQGYSDYQKVKVPPKNYFVLGDNRNNSEDSRFWGFVPRQNIVGEAWIRFWPLNRIGLIN
ncbi:MULTISPECIES: signal peptidase I [unclassified Candidatus Frackibacter]|uniref:signal peptidase I n=1 Tax=unclassified Candidatus Frackibacter TaxID=2648818 RepID=UPI00079A48DE|nr:MULTISPECIES: signal peptidase I [unclassified Candidatus Frackibacter]KXS45484.1 MAG: signal peptidase I [Candidatus Frackibacter sp. T328-2]SDC00795.1 signal peptidase I [Candidatus Frackibacter sp. WG11]SEM32184.1 signal peptidase I [Candidatus Frackibacter sp. WG12]SFL37090.1 signal peptidase I [Candidatus Frackibacter sp. WG13]